MKKKTFTQLLSNSFIILGTLLFSCTESDNLLDPADSGPNQSNQTQLTLEEIKTLNVSMQGAFVSEDHASQKANAFFGKVSTKTNSSEKSRRTYWVKYTSALPQMFSSDSKPDSIPIYLINYKDGSSILISGDERIPEVLAYSNNNSISLEKNGSGLDVIIDNLPAFVSYKIDNFESRYDSLLQISLQKTGLSASSVPLQRIENNLSQWETIYDYAPMVPVKWDQDGLYNQLFPPIADKDGSLAHAHAGCTAVATAQILAYYKYPSIIRNYAYHWQLMTSSPQIGGLDITGQKDIQNLLFDIAKNCNPSYSSSGTGISHHDANTYIKNIGYTTDGVQQYNKDKVVNSIKNYHPVLTVGNRIDERNNYKGHAWVIDGANARQQTYTEQIYEYIGTNPKPANPINPEEWRLISDITQIYKEEYVRCNFGYGGDYDDVNYNHELFRLANGREYIYDLEIITNITPK